MPIETLSLKNKNLTEESHITEDNSKNRPISISFDNKIIGENAEIPSEFNDENINNSIFETTNEVHGDVSRTYNAEANSISFGNSIAKKEANIEEEGFFSKLGSNIKSFFYGNSSNEVHEQRKELKTILSTDKSDITKLLDFMKKEYPTEVGLVKNMLSSINKSDSKKTRSMNQLTEKALINLVEKFKDKLRNSELKADPEILKFINKLDKTNLLEKMEERTEAIHNFTVSVNNVVKINNTILSKLTEIRKTDPETADFLKSLVSEFKDYEKNPALFIMYGQYMKNVLAMVENNDFDGLQDFNDKFEVIFEKIKVEIKSEHTDDQKKQAIMSIINENKELINFDIIDNKSASSKKLQLSDIVEDIFENHDAYSSTDNNSDVTSSGQQMSVGLGSRLKPQVNMSETTENQPLSISVAGVKEPESLPNQTNTGVKFNSALSASSLHKEEPHDESNSTQTTEALTVKQPRVPRPFGKRIGNIFKAIKNLTRGNLGKHKATINTYLKDDILKFNSAMFEVKITATVLKKVNTEYFKEYDKFTSQLTMINELLKTNSIPNNDNLEEDKKTLDELIKKANEEQDLMDLSINFVDTEANIVSLLENLRNIIVELDLGLRAIKNKTDSKVQIDTDFLKNVKENEKRYKKLDQVRDIMNKIFKSSKEVNMVNVSDRVKRATFKSDLKVLALAIQELSAMGVSSAGVL